MDMTEQRFLNTKLRGELVRDEPMSKHTSWRVGGTADFAYRPADLDDLIEFIRSVSTEQTIYMVGLGSNLLVRDGGIRGVVIFMHAALSNLQISEHIVCAQAGVASPKVARLAATQGLHGAEFLAGIPGTIGGALAMNAGCYGSETWEIVESVQTIDRFGNVHQRTPQDYELGYRHVVLKPSVSNAEEWFIGANLRLQRGDADLARQTIKSFLTRRIVSQPLQQPNAGSVFRNPPNDYAARLIEGCGLKGYVIGGAMVSPKHANFIVNTGTARAADIENLILHVQETVHRERGVRLEREVRIIGEAA